MSKRPEPRSEAWVSLDDIVRHLSVSRDTVYRWIDDRDLPAHKVGRLWKFKVSEVDEWVRSGKPAEGAEPESEK
jgi:excisionase family DNA binding protein